MPEIIPAILAKSPAELKEKVREIPAEIALMELDILEEDTWTGIGRSFQAHLMVKEPEKIVPLWAERGARRITVHKLEGIEKGGFELGLGVELHVPLEEIFPKIGQVDFVQLMSIRKIGAQGHPLEEEIFDRIRIVKDKFPSLPVAIDGGINESNWEKLVAAGADRLVVGSSFKSLWKSLTRG